MKIIVAWGGISDKGSFQYQNIFLPLRKINKETIAHDYSKNKIFYTKKQMNDKFVRYVENEKPDVLFISITNGVLYPQTILQIKNILPDMLIFFFFTDDNWLFPIFSRYWQLCADLIITIHGSNVEKYRKLGKKALWAQWTANSDVYKKKDLEKKYDVTFVGGVHSNRYEVVKYLKENGVKVRVFGNGWDNYGDLKDVWGGRISTDEFVDIINQSKINLSLLRSSLNDRYEIKGRLFEIPCAGGFQLCEDFPQLYEYYKKDEEIAAFNGKKDLLDKINYFLKHDVERESIAAKSRSKTLEKYTCDIQFKKILDFIIQTRKPEFTPPISDSKILVLYDARKVKKLSPETISSLNSQTVEGVEVIVVGCKENLSEIRYPLIAVSQEELDSRLSKTDSDYISFISDGVHWEPQKLQFQAFSLDSDKKEGVEINFAGWGIFRKNIGEYATFFLRWLRNYAGDNENVYKLVEPNSLMITRRLFEKEKNHVLNMFLKNDDLFQKNYFSHPQNYKYIDMGVSLVWLTEEHVEKIFGRYNEDFRSYIYKRVISLAGLVLLKDLFFSGELHRSIVLSKKLMENGFKKIFK